MDSSLNPNVSAVYPAPDIAPPADRSLPEISMSGFKHNASRRIIIIEQPTIVATHPVCVLRNGGLNGTEKGE
jgi:hypothetical protein